MDTHHPRTPNELISQTVVAERSWPETRVCWHRPALAIMLVALLSVSLGLSAAADLDLVGGDTAQVAYTDGEGVNVRDAAGTTGNVITTLPDGFAVAVDDAPLAIDDGSNWYAVTVETDEGTFSGWIAADYLTLATDLSAQPTDADSAASDVPIAVNSDGSGLNLRVEPSATADIVATIPDGALVEVLAPAVADDEGTLWSQVRYDGVVGYSASEFLGAEIVSTAADTAIGVAGTGPLAAVAGTAGDGLIMRAEPSPDATFLTTLPDGTVVTLVDGPTTDANGNDWTQIDVNGTLGWVHSVFLTELTPAAANALTMEATDGGATVTTSALAYLGAPYLSTGTTPDGFDSSGFTYWVMNQILGYDFPSALEDQMASGEEVALDDLLPGDLVFFQNTYQAGLTHVGVYLGAGQFVSASNETRAVAISSLNDPYWQARYLTARRVS